MTPRAFRPLGELLKRRPGLGTLVGDAEALRVQLFRLHGLNTAVPRS